MIVGAAGLVQVNGAYYAALRRWLRDQEDEIRKLTGELHRVKLDRLDGAKRIDELLAEIERLRQQRDEYSNKITGDLMPEIEQFRGYNTVTHKIIEDQQSEIERLRDALILYLDTIRLIREGKPVPVDFLEKRVCEALGER